MIFIPHSRPFIDEDELVDVMKVLTSGWIAQGEKVRRLEETIAKFVGTKYAAAVSSGSAALYLALKSLDVGPGDKVIIPSYICSSPFWAVKLAGAEPRIVDISLSDFNIDPSEVKKKIRPKTKAIIVPHMFGCPAEIDELVNTGVPVIEDCAQALGAEYKDRPVGSFGTVSVFSFYATKIITTGEGGMILTNRERIIRRVKEMRDYDKKSLKTQRFNFKMTDFQAALGIAQMRKLQSFIGKRRQIASLYSQKLQSSILRLPEECDYKKSVYYRYIILTEKRRALQIKAKGKGISCERPVWKPLHRCLKVGGCPQSDLAYDRALSLPIYPRLSSREQNYIINKINLILKELSSAY